MKKISTKTLYVAWAVSCLFALFLFMALLLSHWFFIVAFFFLVWFIVMILKSLQCPHCGKMETLINLTYSINHQYFCRHCGQQIKIKKEN